MSGLADLLAEFLWYEAPLTATVREAALQYMIEYNLGAQDAVHLASALLSGVRDFASFDRRFRRVDGLYLWNDLAFNHRPA